MSDLVESPGLWFDIAILCIVIVSAVMSLGRGLIREAFSVISFIIGGLAAYYCVVLFEKPLAGVIPKGWPSITPSAILVVVGFLAAYSLAAFLGGRLSKLIHSSPEIGVIDRIAGAAFGVVRALLAAILFVLLMQQVLPDNATPSFVAKAQSYKYLNGAASWIRGNIPGFVARASETIKEPVSDKTGKNGN